MAADRYAEACPKLAESQRLDPATGTLLNLAVCHEKQGKTATAWAEYNDVAAASRMQGNAERQRIAAQRISELEPKLCRLYIVSSSAQNRGLIVRLDGVELGSAALGTAMPVDPGIHDVEVMAQQRKVWAGQVTVSGEGSTGVVVVAVDEPILPSAAPAAVDGTARADAGRKRILYVAAATGIAALGVGTYFGLRAKAEWDERNELCTGNSCRAEAVGAADRARALALGADGAFAVALTGLGIAAYLALTPASAPAVHEAPLSFGTTGSSAQVSWRGRF